VDVFAALDGSAEGLFAQLTGLSADELARPSACEGWTVRDVASHVVGGAVRYRMLLEGATDAQIAPTRTMDFLGEDAERSARETHAALMDVARTADLGVPVHHRAGDRPGSELLVMRLFEVVLHTWDISRGTGRDAALVPAHCAFLLDWLGLIEEMRPLGVFDPPVAGGDAPCARLLGASGRVP
jgi:uncharacterized protein (TIGR03086 family)